MKTPPSLLKVNSTWFAGRELGQDRLDMAGLTVFFLDHGMLESLGAGEKQDAVHGVIRAPGDGMNAARTETTSRRAARGFMNNAGGAEWQTATGEVTLRRIPLADKDESGGVGKHRRCADGAKQSLFPVVARTYRVIPAASREHSRGYVPVNQGATLGAVSTARGTAG